MKEYWFKRKKYGWGWTPCSREGWLVTLFYILALVFVLAYSRTVTDYVLGVGFCIGGLIYICYAKGESPRWSWGE